MDLISVDQSGNSRVSRVALLGSSTRQLTNEARSMERMDKSARKGGARVRVPDLRR